MTGPSSTSSSVSEPLQTHDFLHVAFLPLSSERGHAAKNWSAVTNPGCFWLTFYVVLTSTTTTSKQTNKLLLPPPICTHTHPPPPPPHTAPPPQKKKKKLQQQQQQQHNKNTVQAAAWPSIFHVKLPHKSSSLTSLGGSR